MIRGADQFYIIQTADPPGNDMFNYNAAFLDGQKFSLAPTSLQGRLVVPPLPTPARSPPPLPPSIHREPRSQFVSFQPQLASVNCRSRGTWFI